MDDKHGTPRDGEYLAGLPREVITKPGYLWTTAERDAVLCSIFGIMGDSNKGRHHDEEGDRHRNDNRRRLIGYIAYYTDDASDLDLMDALSLCSRRFWHDGEFLDQLRASIPDESFERAGRPFVEWFRENFPDCARTVRKRLAKRFEHALAVLERRQPGQPFYRATEELPIWLERLLSYANGDKVECKPSARQHLLKEAAMLDAKERYIGNETFKSWFLRMELQLLWERIATYEAAHPYHAGRDSLEDWFVKALAVLPDAGILLRGYKSFDPQIADFGQWFFGMVVSGAIDELKRLLKNREKFTPWEEWKRNENEEMYGADEAEEEQDFDGWTRELLESALVFCEGINPPQITARRKNAFCRYAQALRMKRLRWMSYKEMAGEFGTEVNARRIVSRAWDELFALFGEVVDTGRAVRYAQERAPECVTREEMRRMEQLGSILLAVYEQDAKEIDRLSEAWIDKVALSIGLTNQTVREAIHEAWKVLLRTLDRDGKSFYDFKI